MGSIALGAEREHPTRSTRRRGRSGDDGLRRDRWGRLLVVPPGGDKPEGYTRVTTVAKATDEGGGLMPWKATLAVVGTLRRRGLRAQWETLLAAHGDPWYAGEGSKATCKRLVEECAEAGGAGDRREQGLSLHAITAQVDRGEAPAFVSEELAADLEAYRAALEVYGVALDGRFVETTVVLDTYRVGGTFDRLAYIEGHELAMIADLKTGADLSYSWGSFAVQIAAYAHAEARYIQGPTPAQDRREPMPAVDQHEGLVIWLPAGQARCELHVVDLVAGWQGFELSMAVRAWRQRKDLSAPLCRWTPAEGSGSRTEPSQAPTGADVHTGAVRAWLQARIDVIGELATARADLSRSWPGELPTLRASQDHSLEALGAIEALCDDVEARWSIPFGPRRPGSDDSEQAGVNRFARAFPNTQRSTQP